VNRYQREKNYQPKAIYESNPELRTVMDQLVNGFFTNVDINEFREIFDRLMHEDTYFILQDFQSYVETHDCVNKAYQNRQAWLSSSVVNIAKSGVFSSDRSIMDYANTIWHTTPMI
jgi:starch phosphorylase